MKFNVRTVLTGTRLLNSPLQLPKLAVFLGIAIATALQLNASSITQLSLTYAPSQTANHQSLTLTVTPVDGSFSAINIGANNNGGLQFFFHESVPGAGPVLFAYAEFIAPNGSPLVPGTYARASNFQFASPGAPILSIALSGEEQDGASEEFTILQLTRSSSGAIQSFGADFTVFDSITGAIDISGKAYYNFDGTLAAPEPASFRLVIAVMAIVLSFGTRWPFRS